MQTVYLYLNRSSDLKCSRGFTYIGLMLIVAIAGIALSGVGIVWKTEMQRENEKELRFVGEQYVAAIASYYECKVCGPRQLPKNLKDLLKDTRAPGVVRHIRKLYRDPMTRSNDWGLIRSGDRITGVYSKSTLEPLAKPYNPDLLNKKKDATKLSTSTTENSANTSQLNVNQVNASQSSGFGSNNSMSGQSVLGIDKSNTSKTTQPMKPKKPSYQDWQFVYGGAVPQGVTQSNVVPDQSTGLNLSSSPEQPAVNINGVGVPETNSHQQSINEVCQPTYSDAIRACRAQQFADKDHDAVKICLQSAKDDYDNCTANVR